MRDDPPPDPAPNRDYLSGMLTGVFAAHKTAYARQVAEAQVTLRRLLESDRIQEQWDYAPVLALVDALRRAGVAVRIAFADQIMVDFRSEPIVAWQARIINGATHKNDSIAICTHYHYQTGDLIRYWILDDLDLPGDQFEQPRHYAVAPEALADWLEQLARRYARFQYITERFEAGQAR